MTTSLARRIPWTLVVFLVAMVVPWLGSRYDTFLATQIAISGLFAVSLNLLLGTTGLVSFGHVAYFGIGAYVCGILMKTYAVPFSIALPAAALGAALASLVFGFFCVRLTRIYFAMLSLAFSQIVTLYVTPVFYTYLDAFQHRLGRRRRPPPELVRRTGKEEALKPESAAVG